jgi:hypothetical protein
MTYPIRSGSGLFNYTLGDEFNEKHVAEDLDKAEKKARDYYDPWHKNRHLAAVTVIVRGSLAKVTNAVEVKAKNDYAWSLVIQGVEAVTMGPSDRAGINGDPGQLDSTDAVIVSGYNTGPTSGKITHIAASQ